MDNNGISLQKNEFSFENKFLKEMNVSCIINIDNSSKSEYKIKKSQYKNNIYKKINCSKFSLIIEMIF